MISLDRIRNAKNVEEVVEKVNQIIESIEQQVNLEIIGITEEKEDKGQ